VELFVLNGRFANWEKIASTYPGYLREIIDTNRLLFYETGALDYQWRFYVAFMASATVFNDYMMKLVED
jgi:hypothetical protein